MQLSPASSSSLSAEADLLPPITFADFEAALEELAMERQHKAMIPFLVSALKKQAPFLTGRTIMFEILCSAICLADLPLKPRAN